MMKQLRANNQRVQRSVARAASAPRMTSTALEMRMFGLGTDNTATAWNVKPSVHTTAICTFGKYHARRLQEMPT